MKIRLLAMLTLVMFITVMVYAQEPVPLSLQQAIETSLNDNKEIIISKLDEESARARYRQTNAIFLPQVNVSYTAMSTNNPLNAFGFKLQQEAVTPMDFNPELLNDPGQTRNYLTRASVQQPLINLDMMYARKAAHQAMEAYEHTTRRTREYLTFEVRKAYAQLQLAHQAKEVLEEALKTVREIHTSTQNRFENGFLQKSDVLNVAVRVKATENQLAEMTSNVQNASDHLSLLMGKSAGAAYTPESRIELFDARVAETTIPDQRADFKAMQAGITAQEMMVSSGKMSLLPKLNAFGDYYINDNEATGFGANSYLIGAQLSWTLFNGMATKNKIAEQRIQRNKLSEQLVYQKAKSQLDLDRTLRQLDDYRFLLNQHEAAVEQAAEALRILNNRYRQGLVTTNDILQGETQLSQQKLSLANAVFQHNTTLAYYAFLTSTSE
jgi:outer membrane protein TolC